MQVWVPLIPPRPPTDLILARLTRRSRPLTFTGRPLPDGLFHLVVIGQPIETFQTKVWAQPTTRFPPVRLDMVISTLQVLAAAPSVKRVTLWSRVLGVYTFHHNPRKNLMDVDINFVSLAKE